jgi:hypothetical protein
MTRQWWDRMVQSRGELVEQPAKQQTLPQETGAVQGKRDRLPRINAGGGNVAFDLNQRVGLVRAERLAWGPWAVTLDSMRDTNAPWPPQFGFNVTGRPRAIISWGVGGLRREIEFDYPFGGGTFVVCCDSLDVNVRSTVAEAVGGTPETVAPVFVGAWIAPHATPGEPHPMILSNPDGVTAADVPPFARFLLVSLFNAAGVVPAGETRVRFTDVSTLVGYADYRYGHTAATPDFFKVEVPPLAVRVEITDTAAPNWNSMWLLAMA